MSKLVFEKPFPLHFLRLTAFFHWKVGVNIPADEQERVQKAKRCQVIYEIS